MSSFDKVVKLACKPKAAPPKAKYLDPIIAATWSDDGAVHDVCKALSPRFREPNAIVVFKALIVLHTMIRNGSTDNVLSHLSSNDSLRLRNVSSTNWEGYAAPQNLQNYAIYLDSRIRAYSELKHDAIRVQSESNRDMRNSISIEEDRHRINSRSTKNSSAAGVSRSKTLMGRKLRSMTVEKGLLRETKVVHRMIDALVECRFYLDDLEDELTITALRMLVKDLLILFQAGNEGIINLLEHYFEMSHHDAEEALAIYRRFCKQTEKVVEYLGVARKLQNLLNVPIPNLKHAPVSLAGSLQEYLDDPNFEQNRIEYKTNKEAAERSQKGGSTPKPKDEKASGSTSNGANAKESSSTPSTSSASTEKPKSEAEKDVIDFFSSIEEQTPATNLGAIQNMGFFAPQGVVNPFLQRQMATGQPFVQAQPTGFVQPQAPTGAPNPFILNVQPAPQQQPQLGTGHRPFSSYLPAQATGMFPLQQAPTQQQQSPFLQPQPTGINPFRPTTVFPQATGMPTFGTNAFGSDSAIQNASLNAFSPTVNQAQAPFANQAPAQGPFASLTGQAQNMQNGQMQQPPFVQSNPPFAASFASSATNQTNSQGAGNLTRPASTPLTSMVPSSSTISPPIAQPVKTHQTGSRNPFGRVATPPPPVPKQPTLMELAMGFSQQQPNALQLQSQTQPQPSTANGSNPFGSFNSFNTGALAAGGTDMSSVASAFAFNTKSTSTSTSASNPLNPQTTASTTTDSTFSSSLFSSLSSQPTGVTNTTSTSSNLSPTLKPQATGFGGIKPFKPSSSFGASLLESLPPVPSGGSTPTITSPASPSSDTPTTNATSLLTPLSGFSALNSQPTGFKSSVGVGLRPQMTGSVANPFRASMAGQGAGTASAFGLSAFGQQAPPVPPLPNAFTGVSGGNFGTGPGNAFGASTGQNLFGALNAGNSTGSHNQQQPPQASLI
ncbi:hypothetical protein AX16_001417 [Volvariella volvacea WC 439]|nr:hypothetical protein AX16_001417 [Volvariella volvacea WC 439]